VQRTYGVLGVVPRPAGAPRRLRGRCRRPAGSCGGAARVPGHRSVASVFLRLARGVSSGRRILMGLLKSLVLLPLAPVRGVVWVAERVAEQAERELHDPVAIRRELEDLAFALETGEIDEAEYDRAESALLDRLDAGRGMTTGR